MTSSDNRVIGLLDEGQRLEGGGDLQGAVRTYRTALSIAPDDPRALNRLGVAAYRAGRLDQAEALIRQAIDKEPDRWEYHKDLGNVFKRQGRLEAARASLLQAVSLAPESAIAHYDLGIVYQLSGRSDRALASYRSAVHRDPNHAHAWNNMGLILMQQGERDKAVGCFETAIAKNPGLAGAYNNLAMVFVETGQFQEAIRLSRKTIVLDPNGHAGFHNMGNALLKKDLYQQAISCFRKGLEKCLNHPELLNSLGVAHQKNGEPEQAIACFQGVVNCKPDAQKSFIHLYNQMRQICDWSNAQKVSRTIDSLTCISLDSGTKPAEPPFMSVCRDMNEKRHFEIARLWSRDIERQAEIQKSHSPFPSHKRSRKKIRIGYLTNNFRNHPTTHLLCRLFGFHDRKRFHVHAYSCSSRSSNAYARIVQQNCDAFTELFQMNDRDAAGRIFSDGIDILVDLNGYTDGHRMQISALRAAPVQVRYLGMAGTTGASFFDYLICDGIVAPKSSGCFYSEKFVHMPHSYQVNSYRLDAHLVNSQSKSVKAEKSLFTYCCFCTNYKFEAELFKVWMNIIKRVPESVLWLLGESSSVSRNLHQIALSEGVDPGRLLFAEKNSKEVHLARLRDADVALDTYVVNGAATTSDALWAGVPVITVKGSHFASRMSASILTAVALPELITENSGQYEDLAVALATHPGKLKGIREKLEKNKESQPLFDTRRFVRNLENAYEQMWEIYTAGEKPRHIYAQDCGPILAM